MILKSSIGKAIGAITLLALMLLPMSVQFGHIFEDHEHVACKEQKTHFHEDESTDCSVCDFRMVTANYDIPEYIEFLDLQVPNSQEKHYVSFAYHSFNNTYSQLRAPPHFFI